MTDTARLYDIVASWLYEWGAPVLEVRPIATALLAVGAILVSVLVWIVLRSAVGRALSHYVSASRTKLDDKMLGGSLLPRLWLWAALLIFSYLIQSAFRAYPATATSVTTVMKVVMTVISTAVVISLINNVFAVIGESSRVARENEDADQYNPNRLSEEASSHSLGGVRQMFTLVASLVAFILIVSILTGKDIVIILSGLGASAAVLMLVFRDSILGLVAGIQLTANNMLRPGDWISIPKYDVNGRVRKINLTTVKVQNYDNTIITIPPYQLVSETFQNWRGMERSGGRRIMRSVIVDISTVRFCSAEERRNWSEEPWAAMMPQGEWVNVSAYRAYLRHYISTIPGIVPDMLTMIRELQPVPQGLPVEVYFFTKATEWSAYENVQADVMDHVIAVASRFGVRIYQAPSAADMRHLRQ